VEDCLLCALVSVDSWEYGWKHKAYVTTGVINWSETVSCVAGSHAETWTATEVWFASVCWRCTCRQVMMYYISSWSLLDRLNWTP